MWFSQTKYTLFARTCLLARFAATLRTCGVSQLSIVRSTPPGTFALRTCLPSALGSTRDKLKHHYELS